ncbi:MAG: DNA polymerase III subunit delta [Bacilli bacterium]|nr:DNA polymerase III subunit delta [Bacilli bacterium]
MLYLLYGTKIFNIKKEIEKISKNYDVLNTNTYDLTTVSLKDIIEDANTISLFSEKKLIICENATIFTRGNNKDTDILEKYLKNPNIDTTIIFITYNETIDNVKKITKLIKKTGNVLEFNNDINLFEFVKENLKNYKISTNNINLLIDRIGHNPLTLKNEIEKIKIYKNEDLNITEEDIINITIKNVEINIFKLIDYIVTKNKDKALELYNEMIKIGEEPIMINILLAAQFRIMYQTKELLKKGLTKKDIVSILKIHPYRVDIAIKNGRNYESKTLLKHLEQLADIDINVKTGKINKNVALEMFILKS